MDKAIRQALKGLEMTSQTRNRDEKLQAWLAARKISMPSAPQPQGFYTPVVVTGHLAHVAGQLPMLEGTLMMAGSVNGETDLAESQKAAALCLLNQWAALAAAGISLDRIRRVVKLTGFVQSLSGFSKQPLVLNGASELCLEILGESGVHARVAVGVSSLPLNSAVEIDGLYEIYPESKA
jgi:enamine deaminase RidA (YjgF/YER057c/UK114 family)